MSNAEQATGVERDPGVSSGAREAEVPEAQEAGVTSTAKLNTKRILFVDLLRLIASFQMIHGHTLDALMADELRSGLVFARWSWGRGLVSVGFMFAAGIAFSLSTLERFDKHRTDPRTKWRRFRRIGWLITLGYLLHFPAGVFEGGEAMRRSLEMFQFADVLQCIGFSVLLLQLLTLTLKKPQHVVWAAGVLSASFISLAPLADAVQVTGVLPRFLANYLTHSGGSLFPLFPWSGFVLAGVACAGIVLPNGIKTDPKAPFPRLLAIAVVLIGASYIAHALPFSFATPETSHQAMPWFALRKLGTVVAIVSVLSLIGRRLPGLPRWLQVLAGESLMLYAFHLLVLYGSGIGLYRTIGHSLPLGQALAFAFGMVLFTGSVGLLWHRLKAWWRPRAPRFLA